MKISLPVKLILLIYIFTIPVSLIHAQSESAKKKSPPAAPPQQESAKKDPPQQGPALTETEKLDEVMQAATKANLFNGVALITRNDSVLLYKAYGWRDYEHRIPHDTNSLFQIGSVTKQFTATVILRMQEQHLLKVTDTLSKYFPFYREADRITIKNLLGHSSGIKNFIDAEYFAKLAERHYSQDLFWEKIKDKPLLFEPGTEWGYSNSNYMILGYLIEKVSGKTYEQMVRELIFDKAGMTHSGFDYADLTSSYKSVGYDIFNDSVHQVARIADSSATFAAGAIYTTAGDLFRWSQALYGNTIISQASLQEAFTANIGNYGYGWNIGQLPGKGKLVEHNGGIWGFQAHIRRVLQDHTCIILLGNEFLGFEDFNLSLNRILLHDPYYYIPRKEIAIDRQSLAQFTGSYELTGKPAFKADIIIKDGHLLLTWTNMQPAELFAEKKDFFHFKIYNSQLEFKRDKNGRVAGFSAMAGNQTFLYHKQ